ncbi:MAG TPA: ferrochelatase [Bacteroidia bacterium]|jgi:ferrochelatase|nr:ferrochelatase [Bacteroidia bacterium]
MKTGVLLINLGTPDSPSTKDVRKYLTEFLNDPRVIDINPIGRFLLVNGIIVPFRAPKSAKLYQHIWTKEGSPLLIYGNKVKKSLQEALGNEFVVDLGMRYGKPTIAEALDRLRKAQVSRIILIPLYPQYASSSTGSSVEKALGLIKGWEVTPSLEIISYFYNQPKFLDAWVEVARKYNMADYDHVLFSYHGLPERHINKSSEHYGGGMCNLGSCCDEIKPGNLYCYRASCLATTRALVQRLGIPEGKYTSSFQSRLNDKWIKPYSDKVLEEKAKAGVKRILVFSPAFVADCLETLYEIGTEYNELFRKHGGEKVQLVESLNEHPLWIAALKEMVLGKA